MISINNVNMKFRMANDRINNLKEYFIKKLSRQLEYKEFTALQDVTFRIEKGEVIGIIGSNGAGKSTLLKVISGILTPSSGNVRIEGTVAPLLELGAGFDIDLTARENIFLNGAVLGYSKQYIMDKFDEIIEFSELKDFIDTPIRNFSSGMTMRLAFSIATLINPDILIVDEILSVGDTHFQKKSLNRMNELMSGGTTVLLVSHSLEQIRSMCSRTIWLDHGKMMMIGDTDDVCDAYMLHLGEKPPHRKPKNVSWQERLYTPTYIQKFGDLYFIVDCWHHRVIYNDRLTEPIKKWSTMYDKVTKPQSIVSNGTVYLVEDSGNNQILCFQRNERQFFQTDIITGIGQQPHKMVYDVKNERFYGISSESGQIFVLICKNGSVHVGKVVTSEFIMNSYVRSLNLIDGLLYLVSGPGRISVLDCDDLSFNLVTAFDVPFELRGMNDIAKIGNYFYISVYQDGSMEINPRLVRTKDLDKLAEGSFEDIYDQLAIKGVPYYFSVFDGRVFLTEIDGYSRIISFDANGDQIIDVKTVFDMGEPSESSINRKNQGVL